MATGLELMLRLRDLGIVSIYAEFSGGGDSGAIDNINYHVSDCTINNIFAVENKELHSDVDDYCYTLIQGGKIEDWYNNDGGHGTLSINTKTGEYEIDVNIEYRSYSTHNHEGNIIED
jgi:hypothetical protein